MRTLRKTAFRARAGAAPDRCSRVDVAKAVVVTRDASDIGWWSGFGFRARALMPVGNRPVLFHAVDALRAEGVRSVGVVVGGRSGEDVREAVGDGSRWGVDVEYLERPPDGALADVLRRARDFLGGEPFLVQDGDALLGEGIAGLASRFEDDRLDALGLRLGAAGANGSTRPLAALGGCFLRPDVLTTAPEPDLELPGLIARVRARGGRVGVAHIDGCLSCRGGRETLLDANRRVLDRLTAEHVTADLEETELQGNVVVHPTARLRSALVRGPAIIGAHAEISHAYVGPYTSLGANVVVEGSEIEHSIVLDGAHVCFLGARLEGSIVGRDARIGRDYRVPRVVRLVVPDHAEVTLT